MFTKPLRPKRGRKSDPARPFHSIPTAGSTKARDYSDEAEDSDHEVEESGGDEAGGDQTEGSCDGQGPTFRTDEDASQIDSAEYETSSPGSSSPGSESAFSGVRRPLYLGGNEQSDQKEKLEAEAEAEADEKLFNIVKKLTISRDQTESSNFATQKLLAIAANLEVLTEKVPFEFLPPPSPSQGNNALQDYQIQLMLLEQQNKKRVLMAQQEQDKTPSDIPNQSFPGSSRLGKAPEPSSPYFMPLDMQQPPLLTIRNPPIAHSMEASTQIHANACESELVSRLLKRIDDLERSIKGSEHPLGQGISPPRFQVLHILDDVNGSVCLQEPTWALGKGGGLQLRAESPLADLKTHLRKNDDISFLVYKSYATPRVSAIDLAEGLETGVLPAPQPSNETITIMSEELRVALQIFLKSACTLDETQLPSVLDNLQAPYLFWYRGRSKGQTVSNQLPKHQAHLKLLFDWIERNYAAKFDQFEEMKSRGRISHAFTEYLFFPGDVVVDQNGNKTQAYRLRDMPTLQRAYGRNHDSHQFEKSSRVGSRADERNKANEAWAWDMSCSTIVYDGQFYRQNETLTLKLVADSHDQEVDIAQLSIIPLPFVSKNLQNQLLQRGRTFWSCRVKRPISYEGGDEETSHTYGERYVIDNKTFKKLHDNDQKSKRNQGPVFMSGSKDRTSLFVKRMDDDDPPQAPDIYLFPPTIPGFSLRRKVWIDLVVDKIVDISWNKEAFNHLVADDKTKELVHALVADRISSERNTDIIQGKGNGLIILLHGGPGTGKTFTAESVAELAEKPLYPVTCGDIGTEPEQVEKYLESVLYLGSLWDCVVLLDEADVFLEERGIADLARNALVSVFLRVLEYYDGILILTSNRVGTFDEAFKSRISLALHYPNLGKSQRCRIWKNFLNRLKALKEPGIDFDDIECNVLELADEELNGRQIRNAITIGRQLAKFQKKELSYAHLKHVVEVAGQFETYVKETKENFSDEQIARLHGRR